MKLVVTGCGRSGTGAIAAELRRHGVFCGHEDVFGPSEPPRWGTMIADSSWLAVPWLPQPDATVVHLVRDPLECARSFLGIGFFDSPSPYLDVVARSVPLSGGVLERFCCYWVSWNTEAAKHACWRLRIEDLTDVEVARMLAVLGPERPSPDRVLNVGGRNTRGRAAVSREELIAAGGNELLDLAASYGYDI